MSQLRTRPVHRYLGATEATAPGGRSLLRQGIHAMSPCGGSYLRCLASDAPSQIGANSAIIEGRRG